MDFMKLFAHLVAMLPGIIQATETLFASAHTLGSGKQKRDAALEVVNASIHLADTVGTRKIADADDFTAGLGQIIDGVVACLNASIWARPA